MMSREDFLFELGVEELPTGSLLPIQKFVCDDVKKSLDNLGLCFDKIESYVSPRRIAVIVKALATRQAPKTIEKKGPAKKAAFDDAGNPTKALLGFMRGQSIDVDDLSSIETDKGEWMVYRYNDAGRETTQVLADVMTNCLANMPIAKAMRWGSETTPFIRPVHWAVMLFGESIVPATFFGIETSNVSHGHRVMAPKPFAITHASTYVQQLKENYVIASFAERQTLIESSIRALAEEHGVEPVLNDSLLEEVSALVEWPVALKVDFDKRFLAVPQDALIASMESHQKCFALKNWRGELVASFITIANIESLAPDVVIKGNEKVMSARLSDAEFFFSQDKKQPLEAHVEKLKNVIFHQKLGSVHDKCARVAIISEQISNKLDVKKEHLRKSIELSRCDLLTNMVQEFPELQGVMGREYATLEGLPAEIALALFEQYLPRFAEDGLPSSSLGMTLSLADRFDTLVGVFAINEKPTGAKDPFKCRRHALAIIRMLIASKQDYSLDVLIKTAFDALEIENKADAAKSEVKSFILDRLVHFYQGKVTADVVKAVIAVHSDNLYLADRIISALAKFKESAVFPSLISTNKRVMKLLEDVEINSVLNANLLTVSEEKALLEALTGVKEKVMVEHKKYAFEKILGYFETLSKPLEDFFEAVMVNCDEQEIRANRHALLHDVRSLFLTVADFAKLQY